MVRIINIDTKTRTIRVSNGKDDLEWFTTDTGSHVPLKKGQSKAEAIKEHFGDKKSDTKRVAAKIYSKLADRVGYVSDSDLEKYLDDNEYFNDDVREEIVKTVRELETQASERHTEKDAPKPTKQWQQPRPRDKYTGDEFKQQPAKKETKSEDPRKANDGTNEKFHSMFEKFVPDSGPAETLFGEMLRAAARVKYRLFNDGDMYGHGYGKETVNNAMSYLGKLASGNDTEFKKELGRAVYQAVHAASQYDEEEYTKQVNRIYDAFADAKWDDIQNLIDVKNNTDSLEEYPDDTSYDDDEEDEEW